MAGDKNSLVLLAAGGTGGHLFPAQALADALQKRGAVIDLATDARAAHFEFPARAVHIIPSATLRGRNPIALARTVALLTLGTAKVWSMLGRVRPAVVVGFGGYPSGAAADGGMAARHPERAARAERRHGPRQPVAGRPRHKNRHRLSHAHKTQIRAGREKLSFTGNPIRAEVIAAAAVPYAAPEVGGKLRLLVFGGSQGARVMAEIVPKALEHIPAALLVRLAIVQQARPEDIKAVQGTYAQFGVAAEAAPFFSDLPARMAAAHLVISRSGASTVAELSAIGRPAILVPLPHALDQDQFANAGVLAEAGGAIRIEQRDFTPDRLASEIAALAADPARLSGMAQAAKSAGSIDAAERLADLVLKVAGY